MQDIQKQVQDIDRRIAEMAEISEAAHDALVESIDRLTEALTLTEEKPKTIHDPAHPDWEPKAGDVVWMADEDIDGDISKGICYAGKFVAFLPEQDMAYPYKVGDFHYKTIRRLVQP